MLDCVRACVRLVALSVEASLAKRWVVVAAAAAAAVVAVVVFVVVVVVVSFQEQISGAVHSHETGHRSYRTWRCARAAGFVIVHQAVQQALSLSPRPTCPPRCLSRRVTLYRGLTRFASGCHTSDRASAVAGRVTPTQRQLESVRSIACNIPRALKFRPQFMFLGRGSWKRRRRRRQSETRGRRDPGSGSGRLGGSPGRSRPCAGRPRAWRTSSKRRLRRHATLRRGCGRLKTGRWLRRNAERRSWATSWERRRWDVFLNRRMLFFISLDFMSLKADKRASYGVQQNSM